jgi:hypothetical protein
VQISSAGGIVPLTEKSVGILAMLSEIYGNTWEFVHGKSESDLLRRFLNGVTDHQSKRIFEHCKEEISKGNKFAPSLGQLVVFLESPTSSEFFGIMVRVQANEPSGRIEKWLCENVRYNMRVLAADQELKYLKNQYAKAKELEKIGRLKIRSEEILSLPVHSVKNLNDIHREKYDGKINPIIKKIMESKNHEVELKK